MSASAIAVSAFAPPPAVQLSASPEVREVAVQLAAAYNPLQPWIDDLQTAGANVKALGQTFFQAPAVLLQQVLANQVTHIGEVLKNPGSIGTVLGQVVKNVGAVVQAATLLNTDYNSTQVYGSVDGWHNILLQEIPKLLPTANNPQATAVITQVLNVLASPLSGLALGLAGPALSPVVALVNSATAIVKSLMAGHLAAAVQSLINIPAKVVGAVFNGATINLDGLAPLVNNAHILSGDTTVHGLSLALGGLLSPGAVGTDLSAAGGQNLISIGGSIFNALGQNVTTGFMGFPLDLDVPGQAVGPLGAVIGFARAIAKALGWSGTGNPLAPKSATTSTAASGAATSIPSTTTTGVTVSAAAAKPAAAAAQTVSAAETKAAAAGKAAAATEAKVTSESAGKWGGGTADTSATEAATKKSGTSDATDSDSASDASASDSSKSDSAKHASKRSSTKGDSANGDSANGGSANGGSAKRASKAAKSGSRHHGKSHASSGSHSN